MKQICLLSDTHGSLDERFLTHLNKCDEIWHAGDIGSREISDNLKKIAPLKAVFGNIDNHKIRLEFPKNLRFKCENIDVWITLNPFNTSFTHWMNKALVLFMFMPKICLITM